MVKGPVRFLVPAVPLGISPTEAQRVILVF